MEGGCVEIAIVHQKNACESRSLLRPQIDTPLLCQGRQSSRYWIITYPAKSGEAVGIRLGILKHSRPRAYSWLLLVVYLQVKLSSLMSGLQAPCAVVLDSHSCTSRAWKAVNARVTGSCARGNTMNQNPDQHWQLPAASQNYHF